MRWHDEAATTVMRVEVLAPEGTNCAGKLLTPAEPNGGGHRKLPFSPRILDAYLEALALKLVVVEDEARVAKVKAFLENRLLKREGPVRSAATPALVNLSVSRDFLRQIGRNGGIASARKRPAAASVRERNRRNALKRWRKRPTTGHPATPGRTPV